MFLINNCHFALDGRLLLGTETGVYFGLPNQPETFRRLMSSKNIMQLQIVEAFDTVFVLSGTFAIQLFVIDSLL